MEDLNETVILQYLDEPNRFLGRTIDEIVAIVVPFGVLAFLDAFFWGVVASAIATGVLISFKNYIGGTSVRQLVYWVMPQFGMPSSAIREWLT